MPITGASLTFTIAFSTSDFTSGLLTYVSTTPYLATYGITASNVTETIRVYAPDDHGGTPFGQTSIVIGTTTTAQFTLPTSGGVVMQGEYQVVVTAVVIGGVDPGTYVSPGTPTGQTLLYTFCPGTLVLDISAETNCVCAELVVTDNTDYTGWTQGATTMNLIGPIITGSSPVYTITGSGPSVSTAGQALYDSTYTWNISKSVSNGSTTVVLTARGTTKPECADFCTMLCAIKKADALVSNNAADRSKINTLMLAWSKFNLAYDSQRCNPAYVTSFMDQFWDQMLVFGIERSCADCSDCATTGGVINPLCGGGSSSSLSFTNTSATWFTITVVGSNVTIGPSAQAIAYLASIRTYSVASADGSATITPTSVAGSATTPPSTSFDIAVVGVRQRLSFRYRVVYTGSLGAQSYPTLRRSGSVWTGSNPTATDVTVGTRIFLAFSNIVTTPPQNMYVNAYISSQTPVKALQNSLTPTNEVLRCTGAVDIPTGIIGVNFFDMGATDPVTRDSPVPSDKIYNYVSTLELTVDIWL